MDKCSLCGRKITNTGYCFGLGCLKKMCNYVGVYNVKNLNGEGYSHFMYQFPKEFLNSNDEMIPDNYIIYLLNSKPYKENDSAIRNKIDS